MNNSQDIFKNQRIIALSKEEIKGIHSKRLITFDDEHGIDAEHSK